MFNDGEIRTKVTALVTSAFNQAASAALLKMEASPEQVRLSDVENLNNRLLEVIRDYEVSKKLSGGLLCG